MRRPLSPIVMSLTACLLSALVHGCRSTSAPAVQAAPPSTAPSNRIRVDGIYECRGVEVPVANAGWPFPPATARWAYFLRFYPDGNGETRFVEGREPITTAEAARRLAKAGDRDSANGRTYLPGGDRVHIVFPRPFPRYADGVIRDGQLILQWNTGPGPEEPSAFRFAKCP